MDNKARKERIEEIYNEITKLTEELAGLQCTDGECDLCPFKELTTTDSEQTLNCGGFIDLFMYN